MQAPGANVLPFLIMVPLVIWRMHSRIRRSIGRQTLSKVRPWMTISLFPLLTVLLLVSVALARPALWGALAGGIAVGILLGVYGLGKTKFESTPQGLFYTPNAHIGIALSLLFLGRIIYRMSALNSPDFAYSPLTLGIFGLLAGYYVSYAIGLVRWRMSVEKNPPTVG